MQFCKDCGTVLNLFGSKERELCSACVQQKKVLAPPQKPAKNTVTDDFDRDLLARIVLEHTADKIALVSREGWELWSAPADSRIDLQTILTRAEKVYRIRLKRQKN